MNFVKERDKKVVGRQKFEGRSIKNPFDNQKSMNRQPSDILNQICFSGGLLQK